MAPITPFLTERLWQDLVRPVTPEAALSVHLSAFPRADPALIDDRLSTRMALVRRLVELGRSARAESGMKTRQPLSRAVVSAPGFADLPAGLVEEIAAELNVGTVTASGGSLVDITAKANFRALGRRFGKGVQAVAAAIAAADAAALAESLNSAGSATVDVDGSPVTLEPGEVVLTETPRAGWAVASDAGSTVALDLEITPELRRAGIARDVVRQVQEARKSSGLEVTDRIVLRYRAAYAETARALREHAALVADEVLATDLAEGDPSWDDPTPFVDGSLGLEFWLRR
jgi:isoleucyl-tRNA synthetase